MKLHDLKTHPDVFAAIGQGIKPWDLRKDDRGFAVGDVLRLREWFPGGNPPAPPGMAVVDVYLEPHYTGKELWRRVVYILRGPAYGLPEGYVIMSLETLNLHTDQHGGLVHLCPVLAALRRDGSIGTWDGQSLTPIVSEKLPS